MSQELVTYIVLGSASRLKSLKRPSSNKFEEYLFANFSKNIPYEKTIDELITNSKGRIVVLLPPSSFPTAKTKESLKKISMIDLSTRACYKFNNIKDKLQNLKKIKELLEAALILNKEYTSIKDYIFLLEELEVLVLNLLKRYQKDFIQELIHKIHCLHL